MPILIGARGTSSKGFVQEQDDMNIKRKIETIQTIALLKSASLLRRVLDI